MDEGLGWMVEEMGREELLEEVVRLKNIVHELQVKEVDMIPAINLVHHRPSWTKGLWRSRKHVRRKQLHLRSRGIRRNCWTGCNVKWNN